MQSEPIAYNLRHLNDKRKKTHKWPKRGCKCIQEAAICKMLHNANSARAGLGPSKGTWPYFGIVLWGIWVETPRGRKFEELLLC